MYMYVYRDSDVYMCTYIHVFSFAVDPDKTAAAYANINGR